MRAKEMICLTGEAKKQAEAAITLVAGTWYYIVVIWKANANPEFYVNASSNLFSSSTGTTATLYAGTAVFDIGRCTHSPAGRYADGMFDEIRISKTERVAAWRKASYETERDDLLDWGSEEVPTGIASKRLLVGVGL